MCKILKNFQMCSKVISQAADIISERKNATFDYKMLHFLAAVHMRK